MVNRLESNEMVFCVPEGSGVSGSCGDRPAFQRAKLQQKTKF